MDRTEKEQYIIGTISLLSNKLTRHGDTILPEITFKQWFLLILISKMDPQQEKNINSIAVFTGTSRQNVKKMLSALEAKGYVLTAKSLNDARSLQVGLTDKAYQYFSDQEAVAAEEANRLFHLFDDEEIDSFVSHLQKLSDILTIYGEGNSNEQ